MNAGRTTTCQQCDTTLIATGRGSPRLYCDPCSRARRLARARARRTTQARLTPADLTALAALVATVDPTTAGTHTWMDHAACRGDWQ